MSTLKRVLLIAFVLLLTVVPTLAQSGSEASSSSHVRFVHVIPGASAIDIYTDGQLTFSNIAYGSATNYINVPVGAHHLTVTQNGSDSAIWEQDIEPSANAALTLVASSAANAAFQVYQDDLNPLTLGKARFTAIHTLSDVPAVDVILADGRPVIPGLQLDQPYGTLDLPAASYDLAVVPTGASVSDALLPAQPFRFNSGTSYVAVVYGTSNAPASLLLSAPTRPEAEGAGFVRIAHVVNGVAPVDVYVNSTLVAPALALGEATDYIALPAGSHTISLRAAGAESDLASATLDVSADSRSTALITGSAEAPEIQVNEDVVSAVNETTSVFTLINATTDANVTAAMSDGSALLGEVAAGASDSALLEASELGIVLSQVGTSEGLILTSGIYGGVYYAAVAVSDANSVHFLQLPSVSLAQSIASAPGETTIATPEPTPEPTQAPVEAQPTPAPTQAPVEGQPTLPPAEVQPQPTALATTASPTARVLLDPGVNLQLRQYPNREAFSLGLAPSGSILIVNGRTGAPVPPVGTTATPIPPEATEFVDPVVLLAADQDLDPTQTWLNVTFNTADGGSITAWVNALYLGLSNPQGRSMRLRDLPTVPSNRAGTTRDTAVESPSARQNVTLATVTNVDPGVQVHLRRLPSTAGESLALLSAGTETELVGVNETRDWVFVRYSAPDSTVTGWVNLEYVTLQRNGLLVSFDRLQELLELNVLGDDQRGAVISGGQPTAAVVEDLRNVVAGTVVGLNPDANLHLRRSDNEQAESLALLPNATVMVVNGRSPDDLWLQVSYQNQLGWVASEYIALTFNRQPYERATLPIIDTSTPTPTGTLTETPTATPAA
ncbi:MAG: DUF4397 domain-containing protein [Chloroflexota bacterium]